MRFILILSALVGAVTAQTVIQLAVPMIDMDGISVSVVGKDSYHTTYAINCVQGSDEDNDDNGEDYPLEDDDHDGCPISAGATLIVGGSSVDVLYSDSMEVVSVGCNSNYVCNAYASAYGTVESFTTALDSSYVFTYPVTMTGDAGQATIAAAPTLATAGATGAAISTPIGAAESRTLSPASSSAAVATSTSTSSGASSIETGSSSTASSGSSSPTASHNAGVAQATGSHWALGGAAVMALALL
ncbi:hypothetical protein MPDQ_001617 [Monascus purpureus]|uniref:Uncharacterized protein n=1 Tax=Monascus purpureus TaxID=5098 RepID=A0A507QR78_MONPU|nr:hypothetical protein MPDQ_001617 [Monascus purpureus]BDD57696.1 hypothetical protein MAP00_003042 [Monascus purpureus]